MNDVTLIDRFLDTFSRYLNIQSTLTDQSPRPARAHHRQEDGAGEQPLVNPARCVR